jgi:hypothetical protein
MSMEPTEVFKKALARAATATPNVVTGAVTLVASAVLWNPLPLVLWGLGAVGWVLGASTSPRYTRRILDEERLAEEAKADQEREAIRSKIEQTVAQPPFAGWMRAGLLPDYLQVFARLAAVRDRVARLLADRKEDFLAGLGIQNQLTYLLTAYLQFVQARLTLLQTLTEFRPAASGGGGGAGTVAAAEGPAGQAAPGQAGPGQAGQAGPAAWAGQTAASARAASAPAQAPGGQGAHGAPRHRSPMEPIAPPAHGLYTRIVDMVPGAAGAQGAGRGFDRGVAGAPGSGGAGGAGTAWTAAAPLPAALPNVAALLTDLDARIAAVRELAAREPATARTREWHAGILEKQQELLRDCSSRDQQLVAQLTAVPDAFDVIAGRISASQFDASELAAYTGGVVEQIAETEKFVQTMRPITDDLPQPNPPAASGVATT